MQSLKAFCQEWGDVASVAGFLLSLLGMLVSLVGFMLTLSGQRKLRRAAREASEEAVRRVSLHLLHADLANLLRLVSDIRDAARQEQWPRVLDRCAEGRLVALPLSNNPLLLVEEQTALREADNRLRLVIQWVEDRRLPPGSPTGNLSNEKRRALDALLTLLGNIRGRIQGRTLGA